MQYEYWEDLVAAIQRGYQASTDEVKNVIYNYFVGSFEGHVMEGKSESDAQSIAESEAEDIAKEFRAMGFDV